MTSALVLPTSCDRGEAATARREVVDAGDRRSRFPERLNPVRRLSSALQQERDLVQCLYRFHGPIVSHIRRGVRTVGAGLVYVLAGSRSFLALNARLAGARRAPAVGLRPTHGRLAGSRVGGTGVGRGLG